ncbi:MAG: NmrA family NAD(P)-binding protein [Acidiferrobacterales bacterium]
MRTALIMGITGGFGGHVADALVRDGWQIRALVRDPAKLPERFAGVEVVTGNAAKVDEVRKAARGVELIVYGVNAPYPNWEGTVVPMLNVTATVAEEQGSTILFPGNVYSLDPKDGARLENGLNESAPIHPPTRKGELRAQMEARLRAAAEKGARVIIVRAGDFIGSGASSWLQFTIKRTRRGYTVNSPGEPGLIHTYAYLPDMARVAADLVARQEELPAFDVFHLRGYRVSYVDIAGAIEQASGKPVKIGRFPWWLMKLVSPFVPLVRSLFEMRYLWRVELNLDDRKLQEFYGRPVNYTPLGTALIEAGVIEKKTGSHSVPAADHATN